MQKPLNHLEPGAPPPARRSLAHELVSELTRQILYGRIGAGDKLPSEGEIVRLHGVSRTVVREAISRLQASGLVETRHGIGTFALSRPQPSALHLNVDTQASVRFILELRMGLETQAVALAALRRNERQLAAMRDALDDYQSALGDTQSCVEADRRFHLLIGESTGNPYFCEILQHLGETIIPRSRFTASELNGTDLTEHACLAHQEHEAILAAIRRQDPDAARAAMLSHLCNSRERLAPVQG